MRYYFLIVFASFFILKYKSEYAVLPQLRHTHVQDGEAGGITQQIGATNVPLEAINEQTKMIKNVSILYLICFNL